MPPFLVRLHRRAFLSAAGSLVLGAAGCAADGHFDFLGYTTRPNYDTNIHTVYVPIFLNHAFQAGPLRGMEFEVTKDVVREIESKTPYKVVSYREGADTELIGEIILVTKNLLNRTQLNEVREAEFTLTAQVVWRDLRNKELLSQPSPLGGQPPPVPFDPACPLPPPTPPAAVPVTVTSTGRMIPELGESTATGLQMAEQRLAVQIVQMMEKPW
jgi:hypothetical protein